METKNFDMEINSEGLLSNADEMEKIGKNIEDIFSRVDTIMKKLHNSDTWKGDANEAFYEKYQKLYDYFPRINNGIKKYVKYLRVTSDNYSNAELLINNDVDSNIVSLDVNS